MDTRSQRVLPASGTVVVTLRRLGTGPYPGSMESWLDGRRIPR